MPLELARPFGALLVVLFVLYWLPSIIALLGGHQQTAPILVINMLLGWTLVGWVAALALSVSRVER